jgi:hypothetical protein
MKLLTFTIASMVLKAGAASGQMGYTLQQCTTKYGPVAEKQPSEWHNFESKPYHLEIHFHKDKADAVQYLNWLGQPKAFAKDEIEKLLKQSSAAHWKVVDDSPEATMFAFTHIVHRKWLINRLSSAPNATKTTDFIPDE